MRNIKTCGLADVNSRDMQTNPHLCRILHRANPAAIKRSEVSVWIPLCVNNQASFLSFDWTYENLFVRTKHDFLPFLFLVSSLFHSPSSQGVKDCWWLLGWGWNWSAVMVPGRTFPSFHLFVELNVLFICLTTFSSLLRLRLLKSLALKAKSYGSQITVAPEILRGFVSVLA